MENKSTKSKKPIITIAVILLVAVAAVLCVLFVIRPLLSSGEKTVTIDVVDAEGSVSSYEFETTDETLGELLVNEGIAEGESSQYGLFITTVDGITADESKQEWWCITKAGEEMMTGADDTPLADGDQYELTLTTGW